MRAALMICSALSLATGCTAGVVHGAAGAGGDAGGGASGGVGGGVGGAGGAGGIALGVGFELWEDEVQPALASACGSCHLGTRFGMASLLREGDDFTQIETELNYETFLDMISLDNPTHSRLLVKGLPTSAPEHIFHGGGEQFTTSDPLYQTLLTWILAEKADRCADCGLTAERAYIAYVRHPEVHWMIEPSPIRVDRGTRTGTKIMLQPIDPATAAPIGAPIDFLGDDFCPDEPDCDYGTIGASHDGTRLVFECRMSVAGEPWLDRGWNICIAEIGPDGRAQNPRFLRPESDRHAGWTYSRTTPFGIRDGGTAQAPQISPYNKHFRVRRRNDKNPIFSPNDTRVYFSSESPDPRSGDDMVQTYHGDYHLDHLVSSDLAGGNVRTIMRNEGGTVDFPFFRKNGNVVAHIWNLERMDRHLYAQSTADGMMDLPVLVGSMQGPNMWGQAFEMVNGLTFGMTGRRRGEVSNYAPFYADHTVGVEGVDPGVTGFEGFAIIDPDYHAEIADYPQGYCPSGTTPEQGGSTQNCHISKLVLDSNWTPFNRGLVAYNPEKTYIGMGEQFALTYAPGSNVQQRQAAAQPYFPKKMGIGLYDLEGNVETIIPNEPGYYYRHPAWVGKRQRPRVQAQVTNEAVDWSEIHIANVPVWLTLGLGHNGSGNKGGRYTAMNKTVALRVLRKVSDNNACIADSRYIQMSSMSSDGYHPTALGIVDSTGWEQIVVPVADGGNAAGDVLLKGDKSVRIRVPAGELLWFAGIDENGFITGHRNRIMAYPPGHRVDLGVKLSQYDAQCMRCHGSFGTSSFDAVRDLSQVAAVLDYDTQAKAAPAADLTAPTLVRRQLTYTDVLRPLFESKCMSCHSGENADAELSLDSTYSATGNYPKGSWVGHAWTTYVNFMNGIDPQLIVPSYNFTVTYSFFLRSDESNYKSFYASEMASHATLGALAPWEPGYQNLFLKRYYINAVSNVTAIGRVPSEGGNARYSFLLEVLTGQNLDPGHSYSGLDHTQMLTEGEVAAVAAVIDAGYAYTARCTDKVIPEGPNAGQPWGDGVPHPME